MQKKSKGIMRFNSAKNLIVWLVAITMLFYMGILPQQAYASKIKPAIEVTTDKDVYKPGEVINIFVHFP